MYSAEIFLITETNNKTAAKETVNSLPIVWNLFMSNRRFWKRYFKGKREAWVTQVTHLHSTLIPANVVLPKSILQALFKK